MTNAPILGGEDPYFEAIMKALRRARGRRFACPTPRTALGKWGVLYGGWSNPIDSHGFCNAHCKSKKCKNKAPRYRKNWKVLPNKKNILNGKKIEIVQ